MFFCAALVNVSRSTAPPAKLLRMGRLVISLPVVAALLAGSLPACAQDSRVAGLVQAGKLRVGLFASQFTKDAATGELKNVRVDVARALAARIGVPAVFIEHRTPPDTIACLKSGACDLVFLPRDGRATAIGEFSNPFIISEFTMLVPPGSAIETIADADRPGVRIAAVRGHASAAALAGGIKHAAIVVGDNEEAAFALLQSGQADVFASTRQYLTRMTPRLPGSRVLAARYGANVNRLVVPKGQTGQLAFINEFVEQAKASGLIQQALDRNGADVFQVAPPGDIE